MEPVVAAAATLARALGGFAGVLGAVPSRRAETRGGPEREGDRLAGRGRDVSATVIARLSFPLSFPFLSAPSSTFLIPFSLSPFPPPPSFPPRGREENGAARRPGLLASQATGNNYSESRRRHEGSPLGGSPVPPEDQGPGIEAQA